MHPDLTGANCSCEESTLNQNCRMQSRNPTGCISRFICQILISWGRACECNTCGWRLVHTAFPPEVWQTVNCSLQMKLNDWGTFNCLTFSLVQLFGSNRVKRKDWMRTNLPPRPPLPGCRPRKMAPEENTLDTGYNLDTIYLPHHVLQDCIFRTPDKGFHWKTRL